MALNKLTRGLNQLSQAFGSRLGSSFTPASIPSLYYCDVNTASLWSDAGVTPATVGGGVYQVDFNFGPTTLKLSQATGANQLILRVSGSGKRYLEGTTSKYMRALTVINYAANTPFALFAAFKPNATVSANASLFNYQSTTNRLLLNNGLGKVSYSGLGFTGTSNPGVGVTQSYILTATGVAASDAVLRINGTISAVTSGSGTVTYAATSTAASLNERPTIASETGPIDYYGFGLLNNVTLSAGEISSMDSYQQSLLA